MNSNLKLAEILHEAAMEAADLADIARLKKKPDEQLIHLKKAYALEKEAALKLQGEEEENFWKYIFLKSAGWLAFQLGLYEEAFQLVELGLSGNAKGVPLHRLKELKATLTEKLGEDYFIKKQISPDVRSISGQLVAIDMEQEMVTIKSLDNQGLHHIGVSKDLIKMNFRHFIGELVKVIANKNKDGVFVTKNAQELV